MQTAAAPAESTVDVSGTALEPRLYIDPKLLEAEQERIFERTWQLIGHVSALPQSGTYITGFAGSQPVLVVRDEANGLRAYPMSADTAARACSADRGGARGRSAAATTAGRTSSTAR